jgi:hypothetical protein
MSAPAAALTPPPAPRDSWRECANGALCSHFGVFGAGLAADDWPHRQKTALT